MKPATTRFRVRGPRGITRNHETDPGTGSDSTGYPVEQAATGTRFRFHLPRFRLPRSGSTSPDSGSVYLVPVPLSRFRLPSSASPIPRTGSQVVSVAGNRLIGTRRIPASIRRWIHDYPGTVVPVPEPVKISSGTRFSVPVFAYPVPVLTVRVPVPSPIFWS